MVWNFLAWRNRYTIGPLTQDMTQGEGLYDPLSFPDESTPIRLTFEMSLAEFTKVYTALNKGAILSYPDESEDVIWYFLRNFEFPIMADCGDVQDCIETDQGTRETIQQIFQEGTGPAGGTVMGQDDDLDRLFGMIRFLVDTMHDAIVDVFQIADDASDLRERATLLFSAIPGAQILPFDEGANYIDSLLEDVGQQFDSQYTTTPETGSRDRISCGLFCLARDNGNTLTWDLIRDWFWQEVSFESPGLNQFLDFANFLITGTWTGQDIVNISFANLATALDTSARYGDLLFPSLGAIMALGANNPDPDWNILCVDCPPDPEECETAQSSQDFRISEGGFAVTHPEFDYGEWDQGLGWRTKPPANTFTISIERQFTTMVNKVRVYVSSDWPITIFIRTLRVNGWATYTPISSDTGTEGSLFWYEYEIAPSDQGIGYQVYNPSIGIPDDFYVVRACEWWEE